MKRSDWPKRNNPAEPLTLGAWLDSARRALGTLADEPSSSVYAIAAKALTQPAYWPQVHPEFTLTPELQKRLDQDLARLLGGEPLPYITGIQAFYGLDFFVTPDVLIPRPETEILVNLALEEFAEVHGPCLAADVGTGSGCIALALACSHPLIRIVATDISYNSLSVARKNCQHHRQAERIALLQTDLLAGLQTKFDLICANLPYIPTEKLNDLEVARHEPRLALDGGLDGLDLITRLLAQAKDCLKPDGLILLEMEISQSETIRQAIHLPFPKASVTIVDDFNRLPRLAIIRNK